VPAPDGVPTDEELVVRVRARDPLAFGVLYDRHAGAVYVLAAHTLGRAEAEEIVQDVFLRLWQRATQFDPARSSFGAWFMAIARHRVLDELRRRGQSRRLEAAGDVERHLARALDPAMDPHTSVIVHDSALAVRHALADLPDDQRRALALGYFGGFSQSEIARVLGWPLGTVKKRVRLGLQKLRRSLAPLAPPDPEGMPEDENARAPSRARPVAAAGRVPADVARLGESDD